MLNQKLLIGAILLVAAAPSSLAAQACTGNHAVHGQGFIDASVSFTEGATGFGGSVGGFTNGPIFVAGSYTRLDFDNSDLAANGISAAFGAELAGPEVSVCPAFSVGYGWFSNVPFGIDINEWDFSGGLLIGKSFGESTLFTPHASAAVIHVRITASLDGESDTESDTGGIFAAGFSLGTNDFYGGPSVSITTFAGSDPVFSITAGVAF